MNRLQNEKSPYLLQHADNPVDWYPWGDEAFQAARDSDRPVFLSIGYSTCHWCHVMKRESFQDETVASLMNNAFIAIKVDREERPDIDHVYMSVCQVMTGSGGWPMSVWLRSTLIVGLILYLATGLAMVQQDEVGVVRRFGAVQSETWAPGLHWGLPWGLGQLDGVKIGQTSHPDIVDVHVALAATERGHAVLTSDDADIAKVNRDLVLVHV